MSEEQEPFETIMRKMVAERKTTAEQARAELRDRFAMAALTGLLSDPDVGPDEDRYACAAYRFADAMLKARGDGENAQ